MQKLTTTDPQMMEFRWGIEDRLRRRVLQAMEEVLEEELQEALGCPRYERSSTRRGYRNGRERRRVTTAVGLREVQVPRGRLLVGEATEEFRSQLLPRYARRTREVDEAILGAYLSGANSRRIRKALEPLLGEEHLSKSAVSRVVARLKERFAEWRGRDLSQEAYGILSAQLFTASEPAGYWLVQSPKQGRSWRCAKIHAHLKALVPQPPQSGGCRNGKGLQP